MSVDVQAGSDVASRRASCRRTGIDKPSMAPDPFDQFRSWHEEWTTTDPPDAAAVVLATVDRSGHPSARLVDLAYVDHGFVFFTDRRSRKASGLRAGSRAALCFGWLTLARQVRVTGSVAALSDDESDAWHSKLPRQMQLLTWASDQREVIPARAVATRRLVEAEMRFCDGPVTRPPHWGGYRVVADEVEFWQGRADELHDRLRYTRGAAGERWVIDRITP
jgi:pyridoxamine 5'-phosphate oxidase